MADCSAFVCPKCDALFVDDAYGSSRLQPDGSRLCWKCDPPEIQLIQLDAMTPIEIDEERYAKSRDELSTELRDLARSMGARIAAFPDKLLADKLITES